MSFRIIGDEIEYEFRPFARIIAPTCSVLRDCAENAIWACDPALAEEQLSSATKALEDDYKKQIERLQERNEALESELTRHIEILNSIDEGDTCLDLIAKAQAEAAEWRRIAKHNRAAYYEAVKPKPRKRRTF